MITRKSAFDGRIMRRIGDTLQRVFVARTQALGKRLDGAQGNAAWRLFPTHRRRRAHLFQQGSLERRPRLRRWRLRVQLKKKKRAGQVRERLAAVSASLLTATIAMHPDTTAAQQYYEPDYYGTKNDNFGPGIAYTEINAALLVYKEAGGRVQAIEPTTDMTVHGPGRPRTDFGPYCRCRIGCNAQWRGSFRPNPNLRNAGKDARRVDRRRYRNGDQRLGRQHHHQIAVDAGTGHDLGAAILHRCPHLADGQRVPRSSLGIRLRLFRSARQSFAARFRWRLFRRNRIIAPSPGTSGLRKTSIPTTRRSVSP